MRQRVGARSPLARAAARLAAPAALRGSPRGGARRRGQPGLRGRPAPPAQPAQVSPGREGGPMRVPRASLERGATPAEVPQAPQVRRGPPEPPGGSVAVGGQQPPAACSRRPTPAAQPLRANLAANPPGRCTTSPQSAGVGRRWARETATGLLFATAASVASTLCASLKAWAAICSPWTGVKCAPTPRRKSSRACPPERPTGFVPARRPRPRRWTRLPTTSPAAPR
jgi:hypothetical protein